MVEESDAFEGKYRAGYGIAYPESQIIRAHKHVLQWELGIASGTILDFGCGTGTHLQYFHQNGFTPFGCDTSETAIGAARGRLPEFAENLEVSTREPNVRELFESRLRERLTVFLSNQTLYYLSDGAIKAVVGDVHALMPVGGVFIATMMAYTSLYHKFAVGREGDFTVCDVRTSRFSLLTKINFKDCTDLAALFHPFETLHLAGYSSTVRSDEVNLNFGNDHWIYTGIKR